MDKSLSLAASQNLTIAQKISLSIVGIGILIVFIAWAGIQVFSPVIGLSIALSTVFIGGLAFTYYSYKDLPAGIKNNAVFFKQISSRGALAWLTGIVVTGFYIILYWFPQYLAGLITLFEPLSQLLRGRTADQWFVYGSFYTVAVLVMGAKYIYKYRHNNYQMIRTSSVMFFQLWFGFLIPAILLMFNQPEFYFSYFWPLKYEYLFPSTFSWFTSQEGALPVFMIFWGLMMTVIGTPILTYFFGKRWYCSWVCGCGGLAETAGDPFRQLSDKSLKSWKIERWMIYSVLGAVMILTALLWINSATEGDVLGSFSASFSKGYGFLIGSAFSGVIGVGFYPIMGSRVWCRFGCPMAAYLGFLQKYFSRFRITTNGGQCISCGNCSTYCEMGIDVKSYAQRGQNIVRSSCVGCGVCSAVCPRGVLNLENGPMEKHRDGLQISADSIKLLALEDEWQS